MSKAGRPAGLRRAGQVLAAALLLTAVLLSQRGVQIAAPSVACERCSLATAGAAAAAATAAAVRHGQVASTARAGSGLASSQLSTANTEDGSSSSGSSSGGSSSSNSSGGGSSDGTDSATESATGVRGPAASSTCELAVEPSQWADSCILLRDACVDQGSIILYGPEHVMNGSSPGTAPYEIAPTPDYRKYIFLHRGSNARDYRYGNPPIRVRPASSQEGTAYLAQPAFSSCTVPIIWYPMWLANLAHFFRDNAAKLYGVLRHTPWAEHAKFVLVTAEGHAAPGMNYDVLQPLTRQRVETWADFSARLPSQQAPGGSGYQPAAWAVPSAIADSGLPLSFEGGPQRCFRSLFVCHDGVNISSHGWPLHLMGQRLVEHYSGQVAELEESAAGGAARQTAAAAAAAAAAAGQAEPQAPSPAARLAAAQAAMQAAEAAALAATPDSPPLPGNSSSGSAEVLLRVVFHRRSSPDRQLVNAAELIQACNGWRHTAPDGRRLRAVCWEAEPTDLLSGIAAAQAADVFVGVHGANMGNGWLMRPGSSMIELQPYGFDEGPAHLQYPLFNFEDAESQVLWWVISICDPAAWTPGKAEAAGQAATWRLAKNRNLIVSWRALEVALRTAVDAGGDMAAYRQQRWKQGKWWWWLGPGGTMQLAGKGRFTQMRCPPSMTGGDASPAAGAAAEAAH